MTLARVLHLELSNLKPGLYGLLNYGFWIFSQFETNLGPFSPKPWKSFSAQFWLEFCIERWPYGLSFPDDQLFGQIWPHFDSKGHKISFLLPHRLAGGAASCSRQTAPLVILYVLYIVEVNVYGLWLTYFCHIYSLNHIGSNRNN